MQYWEKYQIEEKLIGVNYTPGRIEVQRVVLHTPEGGGKKNDLYSWFNNPQVEASTHYSTGFGGQVYRYVRDYNTAWSTGIGDQNRKTISIECADNGNSSDIKRTDKLYDSTGWLVARIIYKNKPNNKKVKFAKDGMSGTGDVILHRQIATDGRTCPGGLDHMRVIRIANDYLSIWRAEEPVTPPDPVDPPTNPNYATKEDIEGLQLQIDGIKEIQQEISNILDN